MIAIVPDAAVRVMLVEFDTLPSDHEEALGVVRFRLKKSLPFDRGEGEGFLSRAES